MRNKCTISFLSILTAIIFFACNDSSPDKEIINNPDTTSILNNNNTLINSDKFEMVISDIPFPFEILENLYEKHIPFNGNIMNKITNSSKYNQYNLKALNLGVYGADLAYTVTFEQFQQIGNYVKTTKKLAEDLNIPFAFDQKMMDKYNKFKDNKDSLTKVVYDSYNQVDKALKNDERIGMAALVVTGSWLEGLYLSTKTFIDVPKTEDNASLYKTISEQKASLLIVIKLLDEYKKDPYFARLINDLKEITTVYNKISAKDIMDAKELTVINGKVEKLRNRITEGL